MTSRRDHEPKLLLALLSLPLFALACAESEEPAPSRETNWLRSCSDDGDCKSDGTCQCGLCSERCAGDNACPDGMVCKTAESELVRNACGPSNAGGLCAPTCERASDCGMGLRCVQGACAPSEAGRARDGGTASGAGSGSTAGEQTGRTPQAFVTGAVAPDSDCVYTSDNPVRANGLLDIAEGAKRGSSSCLHGYDLALAIASEESGVLQLTGATIELMTVDRESLVFEAFENKLPNPFVFESSRALIPAAAGESARGVYQVQAITAQHESYLGDYDGQRIIAEVKLHGLDAEDRALTFRPFVFPIEICYGCLSRCTSLLLEQQMSREDFAMDDCDDNSGSDGRICWDPDC